MSMRTYSLQNFCAALLSIGILAGCGPDESAEQTTPESETTEQSNAAAHTHDHDSGHSHEDEHDIPLTDEEVATLREATANYADALAHIKKYQQTIETETAGDEPAKAHRPLDNLDIVLERLPEAAQNSNVPADKLPEVKETAEQLRALFNQVHANLDGGKASDYESVAEQISKGIETLSQIQPPEPE